MIEYDRYRLQGKERWLAVMKILLILILHGILFFRSVFGVLFLLPYGVWLYLREGKRQAARRRQQLRMDFKEVVLSIASSMQAGYSLEQSVFQAVEELERLYPKGDSSMIAELKWMCNSMKIQVPVEQLFKDLAQRSGVEEIKSFGSILGIAKRQGGNLVKISREAADHISKKIQVEAEIEQVLSGKIYEKNLMLLMPYGILLYLEMTNPGYLDVLYQNAAGRILMAVCLIFVLLSREWAEHIVSIRI